LTAKLLKLKDSIEYAYSAHNLKVTGSNPVPATKLSQYIKDLHPE
jgi:hypothetical protein